MPINTRELLRLFWLPSRFTLRVSVAVLLFGLLLLWGGYCLQLYAALAWARPAFNGAGLLLIGFSVGALVDIALFENWGSQKSQLDPIEQLRRTIAMMGGAIGMAVLLWLWGRL